MAWTMEMVAEKVAELGGDYSETIEGFETVCTAVFSGPITVSDRFVTGDLPGAHAARSKVVQEAHSVARPSRASGEYDITDGDLDWSEDDVDEGVEFEDSLFAVLVVGDTELSGFSDDELYDEGLDDSGDYDLDPPVLTEEEIEG